MPIPVAPAEHYHMGGIWTDDRGRTSLPGLWAAGEVASTGVHGANRLASNSLLEAVVFAARIAHDLLGEMLPRPDEMPATRSDSVGAPVSNAGRLEMVADLRRIMSEHVGVIRNADGLRTALREIIAIERDADTAGLRNMARTALLVAASAFARRESRGGHMRSDYPAPDPALANRSRLTLGEARWVVEGALTGVSA